jgi:hypothetical protein
VSRWYGGRRERTAVNAGKDGDDLLPRLSGASAGECSWVEESSMEGRGGTLWIHGQRCETERHVLNRRHARHAPLRTNSVPSRTMCEWSACAVESRQKDTHAICVASTRCTCVLLRRRIKIDGAAEGKG